MKTLRYHVSGGTHISGACAKACSMARREKAMVRFDFNDTQLFATPKKSPVTIEWEFEQATDRARSKWLNSEACKRQMAERALQLVHMNAEMAALLIGLPKALASMDSTMHWLNDYARLADDVGVSHDGERVSKALIEAGYQPGAHVGRSPNFFSTRKVMGEYIIGQALNCMAMGMPPHPITQSFCEKYFALREAA
jgi:hypothetical protein